MRIFCTNDDGITAPGLEVLAAELAEFATDIRVGAPESDMSGTGTSVLVPGGERMLRLRPHTFPDHPDIDAHGVDSTPAMTTILAYREAFGPAPDVVVSGPNLGANIGRDIHHSGTVGAILTAAGLGMHGLAVSLAIDPSSPPHWGTAARVARVVLETIPFETLDGPVTANLNVPDAPLDALKGIRLVPPAQTSLVNFVGYEETVVDGVRHLVPKYLGNKSQPDPNTDAGALWDGWATLSWLTPAGAADPAHPILADLPVRVAKELGLPKAS
jgi:5'-nucleotidase